MNNNKSVIIFTSVIILFLWMSGCTGTDTDDDTVTKDSDSNLPDTGEVIDAGSDASTDTICEPGELQCKGVWVEECNSDGTKWESLENCADKGLLCAGGKCMDTTEACAKAINDKSYIGCEYWAVTLANPVSSDIFNFAVAVANNSDVDAHVNINDNDKINNDYIVPANDLLIIDNLPWKMALKYPKSSSSLLSTTSRKVPNSAYHLTSDRPITAYQFSPLEFKFTAGESNTFSHTNDASLLLPAHIYKDEYIAMSRPTLKLLSSDQTQIVELRSGYVAIVGPADAPCTVEITTSAYISGSDNFSNELYKTHKPGDTFTTMIAPFEVLQLITDSNDPKECANPIICGVDKNGNDINCCDTPATYDLTGTTIKVLDGPSPAVFGGHECAFVPYDKFACDHLEQQLFPLKTWGQNYICAQGITQTVIEPTVWRIMSGADDNTITFTPTTIHAPVTLDKGEYIEIATVWDFSVTGSDRVSIAQFMVGQNFTAPAPLNGDPSMSLAVPIEQFRRDYTFLAPETYNYNYLTIVHKIGQIPTLDGAELTDGVTANIDDEYAKTTVEIEGGIHRIESENYSFSITVYGVGDYTSYMYPGGLDFNEIIIK